MPFLKNLFQKNTHNSPPSSSKDDPLIETETTSSQVKSSPEKPRIVIEAPVIRENKSQSGDQEILIKAEPSRVGGECRFLLNRDLLKGYSWFFADLESARDSALAKLIFEVDTSIQTILFYESTLTISCLLTPQWDWRPLAKQVGQVIRDYLAQNLPVISKELLDQIPPEEEIRHRLQEVIDQEINPGVAAHGGAISLVNFSGNTVTINMGGGCQGCSSAALTLKGGVEAAFRQAVPQLGAIFDGTDHAMGENPYYS